MIPPLQKDAIDEILDQWSAERPELDAAALGVVIRIMTLNRRFAREAARALETLGLELFEYDVLSALRRQGRPFALPATVLARQTDLSTGAMTNRIDRLEERGLVERRTDPTDRRSVIVRLTKKGQKLIDNAIHVRLDAARESLQELGKRELEQLADLLRILVLDVDD
jgi:DNA-binding MarR family transcriptional regulator